jgi:hypothetical protein
MSEKRAFKGVWIPAEIWLAEDLTVMEKLFLVEIDSLDNDEGCYASNAHFAKFFGITNGRASQIISSLEAKKYIKVSLIKDGKQVKKRVIEVFNKLKGGIKYIKGGYLENAQGSNTNKNNTVIPNGINAEAWNEFVDYRKEKKKKISPAAAKKLFATLLNYSQDEQQLIIDQSIANDWQGLFALKGDKNENSKRTDNRAEVSRATYDYERATNF